MDIYLYIAALVIIGIIIFNYTKNKEIKIKKPKLRVFGYKIIYTDAKPQVKKEGVIYSRILTSEKYGLTGKPDYILGGRRKMIPVELKSGTIKGTMPNPGDLMQLLSYFIIIEDEFGTRPSQGRLIYNNVMFVIRNTKKLRARLLNTMSQMYKMLETGESPGGNVHQTYTKCRYCICRDTVCKQKKLPNKSA